MTQRKPTSIAGVAAPSVRLTSVGSAIVSGLVALAGGSLIVLVQVLAG